MPTPAALPTAMPGDARLSTWHAPDGWAHRRFDWLAAQPRGRVLIQGGRADVIEKYLGVAAHLHARGWSVTSFDWRGQGGSGRSGRYPGVGHLDDFAASAADLAAFWRAWANDGPCILLAHSMGAHFALRAMADGAIAPDAAILSAPMVQVRSPIGQWLGGRYARCRAGAGPSRAAWRLSDAPAAVAKRMQRLTVDRSGGQDSRWWEADGTLALGPPSWGWLVEAFRSGAVLIRDRRLTQVTVPTLFLVADNDQLVSPRASLVVAERMPDARVVRFGAEAGHEILRDGPAVRDRAFAAIDAILDEVTR